MKVYIFYYNKELYAHTTNKEIRDMFMKQRNMSVFNYVKKKLSDSEYREFLKVYLKQTLDVNPYGSLGENGYTNIASTYDEEFAVEQKCTEYESEIRQLCDELLCEDELKCRDSVFYMMDIFQMKYLGNEKYPVSMVNTLTIFISLYKDTLL